MMSRSLATFVHALLTPPRAGETSRWAVAAAALQRVAPGEPVTFTASQCSALRRVVVSVGGWCYEAALDTLRSDDAPASLAERAQPDATASAPAVLPRYAPRHGWQSRTGRAMDRGSGRPS